MNTKYQGIVAYCEDVSAGVVTDTAGRHYVFHAGDWAGEPSELCDDIPVEFDASSGRAMKVSKR